MPERPDGKANILFKASSLAMFDFIKRNAELENLPYMVIRKKTLAEVRRIGLGVRTVKITESVQQVKRFAAPMVKLVEERKVTVCSQPTCITMGR